MLVVTGGAGFIGRHLIRALAERGHRVVCVDRAADQPAAAAVRLVADLHRRWDDAVTAAFREAVAVFHLAGCPGVRDTSPHVAWRRYRDNVLAGERVLAGVPRRTPLIVASSSSVYGGAVGGRGSREGDPLRPRGGYALSKLALEQRCRARARAGGHVAVVRPFTVAGPGQRPDMAIARWLDAARDGRPLRVLGALERTRDITAVHDVVEALCRVAERGFCGTLNVGTGQGHTLRDVAAAVAAALGRPVRLVLAPAAAAEPPDTLADTLRCRAVVGFRPTTDLRALVRAQAEGGRVPLPQTPRRAADATASSASAVA